MSNKDEKYIVEQIKSLTSIINHEFFQHHMNSNYNRDYVEEYPGYTNDWIKESVQKLYYLILAYFEIKQLPKSYDIFANRFEFVRNKDQEILKEEQYYPEEPVELKIMHDFYVHLAPYSAFSYKEEKLSELTKVHDILRNTNHIVKRSDINIEHEADIYKEVRWILGLYYPSTRSKSKASFIQEFKSYEPDILIPELNTAIEYKYIKTEKENLIEQYIDEIKIDSVNYVGDSRYDNFIAVIYFENSKLTTPEKVFESWKSKEFPKNWKLIISSN